MITLENRFFPLRSAACFLAEGAIILLSVLTSFVLLKDGSAMVGGYLTFQDAIARGSIIALFCQSCMYLLDLYDFKNSHTVGELFFSIIFSVGFVCIGIGIVSFAFPKFAAAGMMYYLTIVFVVILLFLWRSAFDFYLSRVAPREKIIVIGTGKLAKEVGEEIANRERLGFQFAGFIRSGDPRVIPSVEDNKILASFADMETVVRKSKVKKIVVAINERRGEYPTAQLLALKSQGCRILEWPDFFEKLSGRILIDSLSPSFFIFREGFRKSPVIRVIRRVISCSFAIFGLLILFPLLLAIGVLIRIDSPGPVFYRQERVGLNGKQFMLIKFRSMVQNAEKHTGALWAVENDSRVTRVGKWIRKFRIDEFPQLINVLKGDLDLVGPRPERPVFVEKLQRAFPYYILRHTIRPGVTGWAQVMFMYCGTLEESKEKLQYDLFYVKNMSLKLDMLILFRTVKIMLLGRGAR